MILLSPKILAAGVSAIAIIGAYIKSQDFIAAAKKLIKEANEKKEQTRKIAKLKKDPVFFKKQMKQYSELFLKNYQNLKFQTQIIKQSSKKEIVFLGSTSSGKTSLINNIFQTKHEIGLGSTTSQTNLAYQTQKYRVWDAVGQNTDFQFYKLEDLVFFHSMDIIFILYRDSPQRIEHLIKLICIQKRNYKVIFIRTCCDQWNSNHSKTIDEQIVRDTKILQQWNIKQIRIMKSSTIDDKFQNKQIKKIIQS